MNNPNPNIYIAGHNGLLGSSISKILKNKGFDKIITKNKSELDLTNQKDVDYFFNNNQIDQVYISAAKVGGILANIKCPKDFIYENLMIQTNIINACNNNNIDKVIFFGSSCVYPANSIIPIKENYLLAGKPEITNEFYAIAKIAGIKLCESINSQYNRKYKVIMPCNIYGPNDNFDLSNSHVLPALLLKFHLAAQSNSDTVEVWGNGTSMREFLFVEDLAEAAIMIMNSNIEYDHSHFFNVGSGVDISIKKLSSIISEITKFNGDILFNNKKPSGVHRKLIDSSRIKQLGWKPRTDISTGIVKTYAWLKNHLQNV